MSLTPHQQARFDRLYNEIPPHVREVVTVWWYQSGMTAAQLLERLATITGALVKETQGEFVNLTAREAIAGNVVRREALPADIRVFQPRKEEG